MLNWQLAIGKKQQVSLSDHWLDNVITFEDTHLKDRIILVVLTAVKHHFWEMESFDSLRSRLIGFGWFRG
jgi:hypothetical protein